MSYDGARENSPSGMRAVAEELRASHGAMTGKGERPNGNVNQIYTGNEVSTAQIGTWPDAAALAAAVGSNNAGAQLAMVYNQFITAYQDVVKAVEASADSHDKARRTNEGGA
ncbi:hypothetical protein AB0I81_27945 [Nonomuraea sp. NPDC050404]|uniref:hypothetical protein n=1 Tax=Nonomuraea sp. NPDC050404 TaxID=3155783 RepID=UPI003403A587